MRSRANANVAAASPTQRKRPQLWLYASSAVATTKTGVQSRRPRRIPTTYDHATTSESSATSTYIRVSCAE